MLINQTLINQRLFVVDLSKLSDVVKNDVVQKTDYNSKITEIENKIPDIRNLATKTALTTVENKISDTSNFVKKADYNTKIIEIEGKIPDISNLATKTALTTVENKIPNVRGLATKTSLTAVENKIPDISNLATKTALTNLSNTVPDIRTLIKKSDYDKKLEKLKTNMTVILDLTQNQHKQMLLQKKILMQKLLSLKRISKNYKHLIRAISDVKIILIKMANKIIQYFNHCLDTFK